MIIEVPGGLSLNNMTTLVSLNYIELTCFPPLMEGGCEAPFMYFFRDETKHSKEKAQSAAIRDLEKKTY